jgi:tetratricopeptide (TPR) repeat protein
MWSCVAGVNRWWLFWSFLACGALSTADEIGTASTPQSKKSLGSSSISESPGTAAAADSKPQNPVSPATIAAGKPSEDDVTPGPAELTDLIRSRQDAVEQVVAARQAGSAENEFAAAQRLCRIERQILLRAGEFPEDQQGDIDALRDQHLGLLTWLADRYETTDLQRCEATWRETVRQLTLLYAADHWTTRTAAFELRRIQMKRRLDEQQRADLAEAEQLHERIGMLQRQVRYGEALTAGRRALAIRSRLLGHDHPRTAATINNLGLVLDACGRWTQAERAYRDALAVYEQSLGEDHPEFAKTLANLAEVFRRQARLTEAESLQKKALAIFRAAFVRLTATGTRHWHAR